MCRQILHYHYYLYHYHYHNHCHYHYHYHYHYDFCLLSLFACFLFSIGETWENVLTGHADVKEVCTDLSVLKERKEGYKLRSQILERVKMCSKVRNFDVEHNYGNVRFQLFSLQANAGSVICYREKHALTFDVFV